MIKVDEVYPIDINTTIGPTGTIKRLFRDRDYFADRGYELSILACVPVKKRLLTYEYQLQELTKLPEEKGSGIMADTINAPGKKLSLLTQRIVVMRSWKSAEVREATKRPSLLEIFSACTPSSAK